MDTLKPYKICFIFTISNLFFMLFAVNKHFGHSLMSICHLSSINKMVLACTTLFNLHSSLEGDLFISVILMKKLSSQMFNNLSMAYSHKCQGEDSASGLLKGRQYFSGLLATASRLYTSSPVLWLSMSSPCLLSSIWALSPPTPLKMSLCAVTFPFVKSFHEHLLSINHMLVSGLGLFTSG